jgi:hypothetical protein
MILLFEVLISLKSIFRGLKTKDVSYGLKKSIQRHIQMSKEVESYRLGNVQVVITEDKNPKKLHVDCNDGNYHSGFTISRYEFENYKRHMNQKIKNAYKAQYED